MPTARRGEVWQVDLGLAAKVRPVMVISVPFLDKERALYAVIPHTTAPRGTRFEVSLNITGLDEGVFDIQGLRNIPPSALVRQRATLTADQIGQLEAVVKLWLGLR